MNVNAVVQARRGRVMGAAALAPLLACAALSPFRASMANTHAALILVLLIVAVASLGVRWAGIVTALSSAAWFDFFLTSPFHTFAISDPADIETAALLLLVGAAVSEIAVWGHRQQARASRQQGYLAGIVSTGATVAAGSTSTESLIDHVAGQITDVLQLDDCRFVAGTQTDTELPTLEGDGMVARRGKPINVQRLGLPTDSEIALPVQCGGVTYGRYLLVSATHIRRPSLDERQVAVALANQLGTALSASRR